MNTSWKQKFAPESRYGGFSNADGTIAFYTRVNALLQSTMTLLDIGCGRGALADDPIAYRKSLRIFQGKVQRVIGADINQDAAANPYIDEFRLLNPSRPWPFENNCAHMILSDSVIEHLERPEFFFAEAWRVLKDGGFLCFRTPNLWSYPALFGRLIPNRQHVTLLKKVKRQVNALDIFPTYYRANTVPRLRRLLRAQDFDPAVFGFPVEPSYLSFGRVPYILGTLYQKLAPGFLQPVIFGFARLSKPGPSSR